MDCSPLNPPSTAWPELEDLAYVVQRLDQAGGRIVALAAKAGPAYAAYYAAIRETPEAVIRLLAEGRILAQHRPFGRD